MPNYEFRDKAGKYHTIYYRASEAPDLGVWVDHEGTKVQRVLSVPDISADVKNVVHKYPYVSNRFPNNLPGAEHTSDGRPIIRSRQHEREFAALHGLKRD